MGRQADALPFAPGKGAGGAVEGQVVEADPDQECQPLAHLLEHPASDLRLAWRQLQSGEKGLRSGNTQGTDLADVFAADAHGQGGWFEARPLADRAGSETQKFLEPFALLLRFGFLQAPLQVGEHPLEGAPVIDALSALIVVEANLLAAGAIQEQLLD